MDLGMNASICVYVCMCVVSDRQAASPRIFLFLSDGLLS